MRSKNIQPRPRPAVATPVVGVPVETKVNNPGYANK
jgi:hypothetical protein